eukprot:Tbor_TRINITY_DN5360_c1_g1::TRINITY_DN5360_c1_g1_i1::g.4147::m.4147
MRRGRLTCLNLVSSRSSSSLDCWVGQCSFYTTLPSGDASASYMAPSCLESALLEYIPTSKRENAKEISQILAASRSLFPLQNSCDDDPGRQPPTAIERLDPLSQLKPKNKSNDNNNMAHLPYDAFVMSRGLFGHTPRRLALCNIAPTSSTPEKSDHVSHTEKLPTKNFDISQYGRVWNSTEYWCDLCKEPINYWNEHRGKRDHVSLECFYDCAVRSYRPWDSTEVFTSFDRYFRQRTGTFASARMLDNLSRGPEEEARRRHRAVSKRGLLRRTSAFTPYISNSRRIYVEDKQGSKTIRITPISTRRKTTVSCADLFSMHNDKMQLGRRAEIHFLTRYLFKEGLLYHKKRFTISVFSRSPVSFWGTVLLNRMLFQPIISAFPKADAKEISCLTQMASSTYNMETMYELCCMDEVFNSPEAAGLCEPSPTSPLIAMRNQLSASTARGIGKVSSPRGKLNIEASLNRLLATSRSATSQNVQQSDLTISQKNGFVRGLLGQLRWAVEPDSARSPFPQGTVSPHHIFLCQYLCNLIISEIVFCRFCDYNARMEPVWLERGTEQILPRSLEPYVPLSNRGPLAYYDNELYDAWCLKVAVQDSPLSIKRQPLAFLAEIASNMNQKKK